MRACCPTSCRKSAGPLTPNAWPCSRVGYRGMEGRRVARGDAGMGWVGGWSVSLCSGGGRGSGSGWTLTVPCGCDEPAWLQHHTLLGPRTQSSAASRECSRCPTGSPTPEPTIHPPAHPADPAEVAALRERREAAERRAEGLVRCRDEFSELVACL